MDKIKTVKIKNIDGSISEEVYSISVDAKNVDMENKKDLQETIGTINIDIDGNIANQLVNFKTDLNTLDNKIKKKVYCLDTVMEMRTMEFQKGDSIITLGYYEIEDGGAGEYKIVDGTHTDDGGSYHQLSNGL